MASSWSSVPAADLEAGAETRCPPMWDWVTDMGAIFNAAAADVALIEAGPARRARWFASFDEMTQRNDGVPRANG